MTVVEARALAMPATAGRERMAPVVHRASRMIAAGDGAAAVLVAATANAAPVGLPADVGAVFVLIWLVTVAATGDYRLPGTLPVRARRVGLAALVVPTLVVLATSLAHRPLHAVTTTALCFAAACLGMVCRACLASAARHGFPLAGLVHRVVVAGSSDSIASLLAQLGEADAGRFQVVGTCVADDGACADSPGPVTHGLLTCTGLARACDADAVIVAPDSSLSTADLRRFQWALDEARLESFVWTGVPAPAYGRTSLDRAALALLHVRRPRRFGASHVVKLALDRAVALAALVLLAPLVAVLALAVRLDSAGPAFYRHTRVGKDDTRFTMWKLRTMTVHADAGQVTLDHANQASGPLFKVHDDPRVTRIGRWLRRTSLDELPQLLNVLCGQMSLVGPRPALPSEVDHYHPDVRHRLAVHPGITGLWQVSGRSDLSWEESVRLDQQYVDEWSLLLDARILVRTVGAVCRGGGAY